MSHILILIFCFIASLAYGQEAKVIQFNFKQSEQVSLSKKELTASTEKFLFNESNKVREEKKLAPLEFNPILYKAAQTHSEDMLKRRYFSHYSPEGKFVLDRIRKFKPGYDESCGENLHQIYTEKGLKDPEAITQQMMKDWMNSPEHRKNILSKEYEFMGIACDTDGFHILCTQVFSAAAP